MVIIISEHFDPSTDEVIKWINSMGAKVIRLNSVEELIEKDSKIFSKGNFGLGTILGVEIENVRSIWFRRRPTFSSNGRYVGHNEVKLSPLLKTINDTLIGEEFILVNFL